MLQQLKATIQPVHQAPEIEMGEVGVGQPATNQVADKPAESSDPAQHDQTPSTAVVESLKEQVSEVKQLLVKQKEFAETLLVRPQQQQQQGAVRVPIPPIPVWTGKDPNRRAETFLNDIEFYTNYGGLQDKVQYLETYLDSNFREALHLVRDKTLADHKQWDWTACKTAFLKLAGDIWRQAQAQALLDLVTFKVNQHDDQDVISYRLDFDSHLLKAQVVPEIMQALYFRLGLKPDIAKHCTGDSEGHPFTTVEKAFEFAQNIERQQKLEKDQNTQTQTVVNVVAQEQSGKRRHGSPPRSNKRGGKGRGRGNSQYQFQSDPSGYPIDRMPPPVFPMGPIPPLGYPRGPMPPPGYPYGPVPQSGRGRGHLYPRDVSGDHRR
jgi:hypothetical protein